MAGAGHRRPQTHPPRDRAVAACAEMAATLARAVDLFPGETIASVARARAVPAAALPTGGRSGCRSRSISATDRACGRASGGPRSQPRPATGPRSPWPIAARSGRWPRHSTPGWPRACPAAAMPRPWPGHADFPKDAPGSMRRSRGPGWRPGLSPIRAHRAGRGRRSRPAAAGGDPAPPLRRHSGAMARRLRGPGHQPECWKKVPEVPDQPRASRIRAA